MRSSVVAISILTVMICVSLPGHALEQQPVLQTTEPGPVPPPPPRPREMLQRMREMMAQRPGQDSEAMRQCQVVMHSAIFLDSPSAILGQRELLGLTNDQIHKLNDIENQARQRAKSVLTDEQTKKLGVVPDKAVAVVGACVGGVMSNVEQMLQNLMSGQGAAPQTEPKLR